MENIAGALVGFLMGATTTGFAFTVAFSSRMARVETRLDNLAADVHQLTQRARTRATD